MMKMQKLSSRGLVGLVAIFLAMFLMAIPAIADSTPTGDELATASTVPVPTSDHDGDADSDSGTAYTEDNDADGVANNVPDEGDNAHPSGNDRSVEPGGSGNQGNSESTPDQNGNGPERDHEGTDKPNGPGGVDKEDQDGNNGCGNDDDFEDDNEGWCGKPVRDCPNGKKMPKGQAGNCDTTPEEECPEDMVEDESGECVEVDDECPEGMTENESGECVEGEIIVKDEKVTLCHATGSATNPFVKITIAAAAAVNGHIDHQHGEDIIPPFEYKGQTYSQNWTTEGQALYAEDDCQLDEEVEVPTTTTVPITNNPPVPTTVPTVTTLPTVTTVPEVLGETEVRGSLNGEHEAGNKVLGERIVRGELSPIAGALETPLGGALPFTGSNVLTLFALALGLIGVGLLSYEGSILAHNAAVRKMRG